MVATAEGYVDWEVSRNDDGHRDYKLVTRVKTTDVKDGPAIAMTASGLPAIGSTWSSLALNNDVDDWAFCWPTMKARRDNAKKGEPYFYWLVEQLFTTRPLRRCQTDSIENPLSEPQKLSGSFVKYVKEIDRDRNGKLILSSSHERIRGVERDANRPRVIVEQNVSSLGLDTFSQMVDTLNDATLWGLGPRKIKLSDVSWERKLYGTCTFYYTRRFEFDVQYEGFDESNIADVGFKRLKDGGDATDPNDFIMIKDENDENTPTPMMLDGAGNINTDPVNYPAFIPTVEKYGESNFLTLGIPTSL